MPIYRFYKLTSGRLIAAPGIDHDFDGDTPAFEHARCLANGHGIAVWQGARFVANVEWDDSDAPGEPQVSGQPTARRPARSAE